MINALDVSIGLKRWIREVQKDLKNIPNFKKSYIQLDLFEDEDEIWRCGGRSAKSNLPFYKNSCFEKSCKC